MAADNRSIEHGSGTLVLLKDFYNVREVAALLHWSRGRVSFAEYRIHSVRDILEVLKRLEEDGCTIETSEDGTKISVTVDPMGPHAPKLITAFKKWHESQRQQASS